jgi:hypothetical protein
MEYGTIEREIEIDASPATVFEVIRSATSGSCQKLRTSRVHRV